MMVEKFTSEFKLEVYNSELLERQRKIEQAFFYYPRKEKIPSYEMLAMVQTVAASVQNFFRDPQNQADFEQWLKNKKKEREPEC